MTSAFATRASHTRPSEPNPIRGELFSLDRLEQQAQSLASAERATRKPSRGRDLLLRVKDNGRVLAKAFEAISREISEGQPIAPAAEWLVDNFYIVEDQIRE